MTKNELITRLCADAVVTEESARYFIRAMGGTYEIGAPTSKQGGGSFRDFFWCGPLLRAEQALELEKLRVYLTWNKATGYIIREDDSGVHVCVLSEYLHGKHPICTLAACIVKLWGVDR